MSQPSGALSRYDTVAPLLAAGSIIGTYRVLKKIGEGGMGSVYLGEHTLLGRKAAIKVLLSSLSADEGTVKRFFNEARAVTRIADPGIVQIFDFGHHTDGGAFIVMELLEGEPMDKRLRNIGKFGLIECMRLMRLICTALGAAHAKGIVHRDLKPENIFIVPDPAVPGGERAKILDFGIAKLSGDEPGNQTRTDVLIGTPTYMSPEQCRGGAAIDHRSDIYAIGCVMFTMLTGRPPFDGMGSGDLIAAHLREAPPLASSRIPELPAIVDQILQKCLRKAPAERFQSMTELARVLGSVEQTQSGSSTGINAVDPPGAFVPSGQMPLSELLVPGNGSAVPGPTLATEWAGTTEMQLPRPRSAPPEPAAAGTGTTLSSATTLRTASGQSSTTRRLRGQRWIASLVAAVAVIGAVAFIALRGGDDASRTPPLAQRGGNGRVETDTQPAAIDAGLSTAAPPALATGDTARVVPAASDAGVSDAAPLAGVIDAAVRPVHRPKPGTKDPRQPSMGGDHDRAAGSATPLRINRTD
jgi:serine/threonine-protein kinase